MDQNARRHFRLAAFAFVIFLCMAAASALAADASHVYINGDTLTAASPEWRNAGSAPGADWNAYFDTSTSVPTLRLRGAYVDTFYGSRMLLGADGDLVIELLGSNTLNASSLLAETYPAGILVQGSLTIRDATTDGSGSLSVTIQHQYYYGSVDGIYLENNGNLVIESGTVSMSLTDNYSAYAIYSAGTLQLLGGEITITTTAPNIKAVGVRQLLMAGGTIVVTANSESLNSYALFFKEASITGGYGKFSVVGNGNALRCDLAAVQAFRVINGRMIFSADCPALLFTTDQNPVPYAAGGILVSTVRSGAGKTTWYSSMGILASSNTQTSSFHYVEMVGGAVSTPDTGDRSKPWLWLGIGVLALGVGVAVLVLLLRRKK